jgi:anthranilate synthase component 1
MTEKEFIKNFRAGKTQIVPLWIPADLETPVSAYLKLCGNARHSFLLESIEGGETLGRYSIIGFDPDMVFEYGGGGVGAIRAALKSCRMDIVPPGLPPMAASGLFGYLGYDMIRLIEKIPADNPDPLNIPAAILIRPKVLAIFDNVKNMICLVAPIYAHAKNSKSAPEKIYKQAQSRLNAAIKKLSLPVDAKLIRAKSRLKAPLKIKSNMTKPAFIGAVKKAIDYIFEGEIFQAVLSQRFEVPFDLPPFALYRSLRRMNPSPFMFYLNFGDFSLVGSSPEILVRVRDKNITVRPIAGTRPRGKNAAEDAAMATELLSDPKERAEHLMLLDLGRNDVGRVAEFGSVKATDQFVIERYSHVMHIVSNVTGRLKKGVDALDAFFAGFPAGTVSGAPKIRAMEIIDELETLRRSFYAGGIGYFSGSGDIDTCIALRTALIKDKKLYVQAGAGIVADSKPESEYIETVNKAKAIIKAAEDALR